MAHRPALEALAALAGVIPSFRDVTGKRRGAGAATRIALLEAMGLDGSTEARAARALRRLKAGAREQLLDPVAVVQAEDGLAELSVQLRRPMGGRGATEWRLELESETGELRSWEGKGSGTRDGLVVSISLPDRLALGYHALHARAARRAGREASAVQRLIVTPRRCTPPAAAIGERRAFGVLANLYTLKSAHDWGVGDLGQLRRLVDWARLHGAAFVGINPLHAARNGDHDISPYSPVSRLFRNPLYLEIDAVPELAESPEARALVDSLVFQEELARLRHATQIDYGAVMRLKRSVADLLHHTFRERHGAGITERGAAFRAFVEREGEALERFATYMALDAQLRRPDGTGDPRREWPAEYRDPDSAAVAAFRAQHATAIECECYLQFELDRQLAAVAAGGPPLGIYQDLAVGSSPSGSDRWAWDHLFARGVTIGAPPDPYAWDGQNWGLPPLDPHRLRADGYRYWTLMLRSALAHSGVLRIDHVMGLFRLYWVPEGARASAGAYVRYPAEELLAILALESQRHGAVVVGENLGTVPEDVRPAMERWGLLSSELLYFARDDEGAFRPAAAYDRRTLVSVGTHDHVPLAGFWAGRDLALRERAGLFASAGDAMRAHEDRKRERTALLRRLAAEGVWADTDRAPTPLELVRAVHAFLARTPSVLFGVSLDDITGESDPVNLPGVDAERYPSWTRRMGMALEQLDGDPRVQAAIEPLGERKLPAGNPS